MSILRKLFGKENRLKSEEIVEAGACPNCWGTQEYDNKFIEFIEDQTKSNINLDHSKRKAFIQQFVEDRVSGIKLKNEGTHHVCPVCKKKFKQSA